MRNIEFLIYRLECAVEAFTQANREVRDALDEASLAMDRGDLEGGSEWMECAKFHSVNSDAAQAACETLRLEVQFAMS